MEIYFLSSGNSIFLFRAFFLLLEINRGNQFSKTFSWYWKIFSLIFLPEEAEFMDSGNVCFNECFILCSGNWFSGQYEPFFYIYFSETSATESILSVWRKRIFELIFQPGSWKRIFSLVETIYFIWDYISNTRNGQVLRTELILSSGKWFSG